MVAMGRGPPLGQYLFVHDSLQLNARLVAPLRGGVAFTYDYPPLPEYEHGTGCMQAYVLADLNSGRLMRIDSKSAKTTTVQNNLLSIRDHKLISRDQARTVAPSLVSGLT